MTTISAIRISPDTIIETEALLNREIAETAERIATVYHEAQAKLKASGTIPNSGVQYAIPYMKILKEKKQTSRFNWFREKGSILRGYLKGFGHLEAINQDFMILPSKTPSQALDEAFQSIALIGCGEACQLAQWQGIRKVLGDPKFNTLFGNSSPFKLMVAFRDDNPLNRLRSFTLYPNREEIRMGDMVYVTSIPDYAKYHPFDAEAGYNAICLDTENPESPKVSIHGLKPEGSTLEEVSEELYLGLEQEPTRVEIDELPLAAQEDFDVLPKPEPKPSFTRDQFTELGGGGLVQRMWINPERVALLKELPPEEGLQYLATWKGQHEETY